MNDEPLVKQAERSLSGECGAWAEEIARDEAEAADEIEDHFHAQVRRAIADAIKQLHPD
jgi:hypothetical protein